MFDDNAMLVRGATNPVVSKPYGMFGNERWSLKEKKAPLELEQNTTTKKKDIMKKKELERISKSQVKKDESEKGDPIKEPKWKNRLKEDEFDNGEMTKWKSPKKNWDDLKTSKTKKKGKEIEKVEEPKVKPKPKALSAFGTTFYKDENEPLPMPHKRPSSSSERFRRSNRSHLRKCGNDVEEDRNLSETKVNRRSKRKLTDELEDGKGKVKPKGGKFRPMQRIGSDSSLQDGKIESAKKTNKAKAKTAFGSTFRKMDYETVPLPKKKTSSFTDRFTRSKSSKLKDIGEVEMEEAERPSSAAKRSLSKNKLMDMVEESNKDRGRGRGVYATSTGKRARSPYQTSMEVNSNPSKVRVEGDTTGVQQQSTDEEAEFGKEMSFFEKIQQNVRAYFSQRSPEMAKYEEDKKQVQEGENHANDESIMIRKEDRIMGEVKNLLMINEVQVFEKGSTSLECGDLPGGKSMTERNGSGPGGNLNYSFGDSLDISYLSSRKRFKKVYNIKRGFEYTEKRRPTSFHRSKTLQKNALAEPTSESSTSVGLALEPGEQVQNISSASGVASAFAQVQEFHQEITRRNRNRAREATSAFVQEEYLTPIVTSLPGDSVPERARRESIQAGICRSRSRPTRKRRSNRNSAISRKSSEGVHATRRKIHSSRSEGSLHESNVPVRSASDALQLGDAPLREPQAIATTKKPYKPEKIQFVPRRTRWFVYSFTETTMRGSKSMQTPPRQTTARSTVDSDVCPASTVDEGIGKSEKKEDKMSSPPEKTNRKTEEIPPSLTLKDIISLTRRVFQEEENKESATKKREADGGVVAKNNDPSLGYYLEKLMDEKRNYLNMQKTKNFRKAQKVNFIADSFNFFNLLNKEFLSVKTSNPGIEKLRNVIVENQDSKMEDYLDMYKKVIKTSLTKPEQCLMDKAKIELERYTDMYYDLMKYICMEKEGKNPGKGKSACSNPLRSPKSGNTSRINYYEILKQDFRKNANQNMNWENGYLDRMKLRPERSFYMTKIEENRKNREFNTGRNSYRTPNPRKRIEKERKLPKIVSGSEKMKQVVELLSPQKTKEAICRKDAVEVKTGKKEQNSEGKVLLTISVCNDGLIIKQVSEPAKGDTDTATESVRTNSTGALESSEEDNKKRSRKPLPAEGKYSCSRNSVSETNLGASIGTSSDEVEQTQSELLLRTESDMTVYPKSSMEDENDSSESPVEHPMLKFRAFRKLLNEGMKYLKSFGESPEADGHDCPKIPKGGKVPETQKEPIKYPKATISVKEPPEKETKKFLEDLKPGQKKSTCVRDPRQPVQKQRMSPTRSRMNEVQEERVKKFPKRNMSTFSRGVSPSKISKKDTSGEEGSKGKKGTSLWWRTDRNAVTNTSPVRQRKPCPPYPYHPQVRKPEGNALANRISLLSKTLKEAESVAPYIASREAKKSSHRKTKGSPKREEANEELELRDSWSEYVTPTGSYLEWQFGMNSFNDLLNEISPTMLNPGGVTVGKLISEEAEEKELRKMDLSCADETNQDSPPQTPSNVSDTRKAGLRLRCNNPLRTEWDQLLEASFQKDYQKLSQVLNQFMGNISEAWKAAMYLKDYIKTKSTMEKIIEETVAVAEDTATNSQGESGREQNHKNKAIESFRNFLRILTKVFEDNKEESSVRKELFLVMKEVIESSAPTAKAVLNELPLTGNRTVFYREIGQIPQELKNMIAESLTSKDKTFSRSNEDYEPGSFVSAVKEVGEKLKNLYFDEECEVEKEPEKPRISEAPKEVVPEVEEEAPKPKKIYYRPPKKNLPEKDGPEATMIKSNLRTLAEKIDQIYKERKPHAEEKRQKEEKRSAKEEIGEPKDETFTLKKLVRAQSSVYFDATDRFQHSDSRTRVGFRSVSNGKSERISLNTIDESYFALSGKTFGKYRDLIYNKIISFLKSDNPSNINYGMALLGKMMEKDNRPLTRSGERAPVLKEEREKIWYDLVDKLIEVCHVIESEMKAQVEKRLAAENQEGLDEKELELVRTCDYLKNHIDKMKVLMKEMKEPERHGQEGRDSTARVQALEESRQINIKRQLIASADLAGRSFFNQNYLDNAIAFINSVGMFGCSIDKLSTSFFSSWFAGSRDEEPDSTSTEESDDETPNEDMKDGSDAILDCNKTVVMSLKKNIDKRQKKIREIIDQAEKDGIKRQESLGDERLMRKMRDLRKCYNLLEKMICDPTMLPPKWLKLTEDGQDVDGELFKRKITPETDFYVMTALEGMFANEKETRLVRYSRSNASIETKKTIMDQLPIELLDLINMNPNIDLGFDLPVKGQGHDVENSSFQRPKTT